MNAKISVFVICIEVIIYLLLHNLHDCTFKNLILGIRAHISAVDIGVRKFRRKTPVLESLCNKVAGLQGVSTWLVDVSTWF